MTKRVFAKPVLLAGVVLLTVAGAASGAGGAAPPAGEPTVAGAEYASGQGAPYLPTKGAPRKMAGAGIGPLGGALGKVATVAGTAAGKAAGKKVAAPEADRRLPGHHRRHRVGGSRRQQRP